MISPKKKKKTKTRDKCLKWKIEKHHQKLCRKHSDQIILSTEGMSECSKMGLIFSRQFSFQQTLT